MVSAICVVAVASRAVVAVTSRASAAVIVVIIIVIVIIVVVASVTVPAVVRVTPIVRPGARCGMGMCVIGGGGIAGRL